VQNELAKLNIVKQNLQKEVEALRIEMESCERAAGGMQSFIINSLSKLNNCRCFLD
jgi:prefoldin subunit 5